MRKTIKVSDVKIADDGVSFTILVMVGNILVSKSPEYYVKFDRKVDIRNSTVIDAFKSIFRSPANRAAAREYALKVDLEDDFDVAETRKGYTNYMFMDSLGLDSNAVNMVLDGAVDYTSLNISNYKERGQAGLQSAHQPAVRAQIKLPSVIDKKLRFNVDHNHNFQVAALFLVDDLKACRMFNGSVDEYRTNLYGLGTGFEICTSTFINGSIASMIMNLALDKDNFWQRFLHCGGALNFKHFKKLMAALYADQRLGLGYMTDERIAEYVSANAIKLTDGETAVETYRKEFAGRTWRAPSDVIVPLLNVGKDRLYKFFADQVDREQIDGIYALLGDERYKDAVDACRGEFRIFDRAVLEKDFVGDKRSKDVLAAKLDRLEASIGG